MQQPLWIERKMWCKKTLVV